MYLSFVKVIVVMMMLHAPIHYTLMFSNIILTSKDHNYKKFKLGRLLVHLYYRKFGVCLKDLLREHNIKLQVSIMYLIDII